MRERTTVVVVGGGPAGLTAANLLRRCGVACIVLEARAREHVEQRQRAGIVEYRAVRMFGRWGLADRVPGSAPRGAGDEKRAGAFRRAVARARLHRLTTSTTAAHAFSELMAGLA